MSRSNLYCSLIHKGRKQPFSFQTQDAIMTATGSHNSLKKQQDFPVGIIEGFFGTPWDMRSRMTFIERLPRMGLNFYIYAPKNDPCLRSRWSEEFTAEYTSALKQLALKIKSTGMKFGIGFSPLGATADSRKYLPVFRRQIKHLAEELHPDYLALLFDDMKISLEHEGVLQNIFIRECLDVLTPYGIRLITCSSFYTTDPILEKVFGKMPECYHSDLLKGLPDSVDFFWTGSKVISTEYTEKDLLLAAEILGRRPFIWDNYPVNDGRKASDYLYLKPFSGRNLIPSLASGIAVNPMKQTFLNLFPLASLRKALETDNAELISEAAAENLKFCHGGSFTDFMGTCTELFASTPVSEITDREKNDLLRILDAMLLEKKSALSGAVPADGSITDTDVGETEKIRNELAEINEIKNFLNGKYVFDPACLTG